LRPRHREALERGDGQAPRWLGWYDRELREDRTLAARPAGGLARGGALEPSPARFQTTRANRGGASLTAREATPASVIGSSVPRAPVSASRGGGRMAGLLLAYARFVAAVFAVRIPSAAGVPASGAISRRKISDRAS